MAKLQRKNIDSPDETRTFPNGSFGIVRIGDVAIARESFSLVGAGPRTSSRSPARRAVQTHHVGHLISGRIGVRMEDGT